MTSPRPTPLDEYIAALDRTAQAAQGLADTLRHATTEQALLTRELLTKWAEFSERISADAEVIHEGSERYQRWAVRRYKEKQAHAAYKLPPFEL